MVKAVALKPGATPGRITKKNSRLAGPLPLGSKEKSITSNKLIITNLENTVTDADVCELFSEFGIIKEVAVHYNCWGYSLGTAHVVYLNEQDAADAAHRYNGVVFDGRPMTITIEGASNGIHRTVIQSSLPVKMRLSFGPNHGSRKTLSQANKSTVKTPKRLESGPKFFKMDTNGLVSQRPRGRPAKVKIPTAAELDLELEEYRKNKGKKNNRDSDNANIPDDFGQVNDTVNLVSAKTPKNNARRSLIKNTPSRTPGRTPGRPKTPGRTPKSSKTPNKTPGRTPKSKTVTKTPANTPTTKTPKSTNKSTEKTPKRTPGRPPKKTPGKEVHVNSPLAVPVEETPAKNIEITENSNVEIPQKMDLEPTKSVEPKTKTPAKSAEPQAKTPAKSAEPQAKTPARSAEPQAKTLKSAEPQSKTPAKSQNKTPAKLIDITADTQNKTPAKTETPSRRRGRPAGKTPAKSTPAKKSKIVEHMDEISDVVGDLENVEPLQSAKKNTRRSGRFSTLTNGN